MFLFYCPVIGRTKEIILYVVSGVSMVAILFIVATLVWLYHRMIHIQNQVVSILTYPGAEESGQAVIPLRTLPRDPSPPSLNPFEI